MKVSQLHNPSWPQSRNRVSGDTGAVDHAGRGFYFHSYEDSTSVLPSITIRYGFTSQGGGGILSNLG